MPPLRDYPIRIPSSVTIYIQQAHLALEHIFCLMVEQVCFGPERFAAIWAAAGREESAAMEAIILAGGLGTRLTARLNDVPKTLAPAASSPFLEILLRQLKRFDCAHALLSDDTFMQQSRNGFGGLRLRHRGREVPSAARWHLRRCGSGC